MSINSCSFKHTTNLNNSAAGREKMDEKGGGDFPLKVTVFSSFTQFLLSSFLPSSFFIVCAPAFDHSKILED